MPRNIKPKGVISRKTEVKDAGRTASFKSGVTGKRPEERAGPQNVFLAGLPGSGKLELAEAVAGRLGMKYVNLAEPFGEGGMEALERGVDEIAAGRGALAAMPAKALTSEIVRQRIAGSGVMIYLMADMPLILARFSEDRERAAGEGADSEEELRAQFAEIEPLALGLASAILRAENDPAENVDDLVDKLKIMGGQMSYDVYIKEVDNM